MAHAGISVTWGSRSPRCAASAGANESTSEKSILPCQPKHQPDLFNKINRLVFGSNGCPIWRPALRGGILSDSRSPLLDPLIACRSSEARTVPAGEIVTGRCSVVKPQLVAEYAISPAESISATRLLKEPQASLWKQAISQALNYPTRLLFWFYELSLWLSHCRRGQRVLRPMRAARIWVIKIQGWE